VQRCSASICVYCGSKSGTQSTYRDAAIALGAALGQRGLGLVYGGGNIGLMGLLADAALESGAKVVGVIPKALDQKELGHRKLQELVVVDSMHDRKAIMAQRADAFVALPGGFGTLEELFEVLAWNQLGFHNKPIALLNTSGYFDHLLSFLDQALDQGFLRQEHREMLLIQTETEALLDELLDHLPA
jgi:uncharacterized protein (TIGR00730 family)